MALSDDLYARALATTGAQREVELTELAEVLREGFPLPFAVARTDYPLMCATCGYETDRGSIEARDAEHLRADGAHEPGWHGADTLIRSDIELIRAMVSAASARFGDRCRAFAMCDNTATTEVSGGPIGMVPACQRCAERLTR